MPAPSSTRPPAQFSTVFAVLDSSVDVCTVIGFPLGANVTAVKKFEAEQAVKDGAVGACFEGNITSVYMFSVQKNPAIRLGTLKSTDHLESAQSQHRGVYMLSCTKPLALGRAYYPSIIKAFRAPRTCATA